MLTRVQVVIPASDDPLDPDVLSDVVDLREFRLVGIDMPDDWTSADITLVASAADELIPSEPRSYHDVYDADGNELTIKVDAETYVVFTSDQADMLSGLMWIRLRSGSSASPIEQAAERRLHLVLEPR